mgnify:CR=1 FL=1
MYQGTQAIIFHNFNPQTKTSSLAFVTLIHSSSTRYQIFVINVCIKFIIVIPTWNMVLFALKGPRLQDLKENVRSLDTHLLKLWTYMYPHIFLCS